MPWYVIYTKPNNEKKICEQLLQKHLDAYCPVIEEIRQWTDRKKKIYRPLFKSYLFVFLNDYKADSPQILSIPGVVNFIWWLGKPGIVKDKEIDQIKDFLKTYKNSTILVEHTVNKGDSVSINTGPLSGFSGKFVSLRGRRIVLELEMLRCKLIAIAEMNSQ